MKKTLILTVITFAVLGVAIVAGVASSQPPAQPKQATQPSELGRAELDAKLDLELPAINQALLANYPKIATLYTTARGKLYMKGQWYGTTLAYRGADSTSRDTLRVLMQKTSNGWIIRTKPPRPLLSTVEFPYVPKLVIDDINRPQPLPASPTSPAIE